MVRSTKTPCAEFCVLISVAYSFTGFFTHPLRKHPGAQSHSWTYFLLCADPSSPLDSWVEQLSSLMIWGCSFLGHHTHSSSPYLTSMYLGNDPKQAPVLGWGILCSLGTQGEMVGTTSGTPVAKHLVHWHGFAHRRVPDPVSRCGNDRFESVSQ